MNATLDRVDCKYFPWAGVGELSHNAVYGFKPYFDLGCWKDKPRRKRTMKLLKNLRKHIDWFDLEKTGLYLVLLFGWLCVVRMKLIPRRD